MLLTLLCFFLPAAQAQTAGQVKYFPHAGYESRMVGGLFQGSNDNTTWTTLYTVTATPPDAYTTAALSTDPQTFRYLRYLAPASSYGNVAEIEFDAGVGSNAVKLTGTAFGTAGSYNNDGFTFQNALDGSTSTYFNAPSPGNGDYVGIDRGASVGQVRYYPRSTYPSRMVGGQFQGSTDNTNWTTLYMVTATPSATQYTTAPITTDPKTLRYLRYLAPPASYDDVAEVEFDSGIATPVKLTGTGFGTAGSYNNLGNVFSNALDGNTATYFDAPAPGNGDYVGIDQGAAGFSLSANPTTLSLPQGTAKTTTISLANTGGFTGSVALTAPNLPTGVTAAFAPTSISGTATSTLTLTAATTAMVGTSTVMVTGTSGTLIKTTPLGLTVTANPILTSIVVSPATATLTTGGSQPFTAVAKDQNGAALSPQPAITWTSTGVGIITSSGVYSAGSTAGSATVKAASGTVSGTAAVTVTPSISLTAAATSANKITLYWNGISSASGYNVYRSTVSGGAYMQIASGISTSDTGPGLTNTFMYSDTVNLATGTEYFYIIRAVQSGTETVQSNEDSAIPDSSAVPWDTGDPVLIISAVNATATNDLEPDDDGAGGTIPQEVGVLFVGAPDGVVYLGNAPDGSPPQAFVAPGKMSNGGFVYYDGVVAPDPDYNTSVQPAPATTYGPKGRFASPLVTIADHSPYPATKDPSGVWREVQAFTGFYGLSATLTTVHFPFRVICWPSVVV